MKASRVIMGLVLVAAGVLVILASEASYAIPLGVVLCIAGIVFVAIARKRSGV